MKRYRFLLIAAGLFAASVAASCDYASRGDMQALASKVQALQDTVAKLRGMTGGTFMKLVAFDTIPKPPCPSRCQTALIDLQNAAKLWIQ